MVELKIGNNWIKVDWANLKIALFDKLDYFILPINFCTFINGLAYSEYPLIDSFCF
jgi:hypothetical protein